GGFSLSGGGKDLTLVNNNLSNNNTALYVDGYTDGPDADSAPMTATGTVAAGSVTGMQLWNMTGLTIGTSGTNVVVNNATDGLNLPTVDNTTVSNLDLGGSGAPRSGTGLYADSSTDGLTIQNVSSTGRNIGIQLVGGGKDLTISTLDVSNDNYGLYLDGFT